MVSDNVANGGKKMSALNDCQRIVDGKVFPDKRLTRILAEAILELKAIVETPKPKAKPKKKPITFIPGGGL